MYKYTLYLLTTVILAACGGSETSQKNNTTKIKEKDIVILESKYIR